MRRLFRPAIGLMNRLKYPQKFFLISFLFALPLSVAMFFLISVLNDKIEFSQKELYGTEYLRSLRQVLDHAIQHKLLARSYLGGDASVKEKLDAARASIDADFQLLTQVDYRLGRALRSTEKLGVLQNRWAALNTSDLTVESNAKLHTTFIADIRGLISFVGDTTNLILDPDLDSYYLMDAILLKLPEGYDLLQQVTFLGERVAAKKSLTVDEKADLIVLGGLIRANTQALQTGIGVAFSNNPAQNLRPALTSPLRTSVSATEVLLTTLDADLVKSENIAIAAEKYRAIADTVLRANLNLWDDAVVQLDKLLQARIGDFQRTKDISIVVTVVVSIVVVYLWIGFYLAVIRTVRSLDNASKRMVSGNMEGMVNLENRDELGQVANSFNSIATALAETSARRQAVVDNAADGIITVDERGMVESFNPAAEHIFGYMADKIIGKSFSLLLFDPGLRVAPPEDVLKRHFPIANNERGISKEVTGRRRNGSAFPMDLSISTMPLRERQLFVCIIRDITERKQAEDLRIGQARVLEMIATSTPLEEALGSLTHLIESQSEGVISSFQLLDDDGVRVRHCVAPGLPESYTKAIDGMRIGPKAGSCGTAMYRREPVIVTDIFQDPRWEDYRELAAPYGFRACWSTPILSHDGKVLGAFALYAQEARKPTLAESRLMDLATRMGGIAIERKQAEERIRHMAQHDVLTGLPNRALLDDRLRQAMSYAQRYARQVTIAFIDLDHFKLINDSLGHNAGDKLLKIVADRLTHCVRRTDTVVRMGGDEFVIVLFDQPENADAAAPTLQKIREAIAQPVQIAGHKLQVTCSIGLSTYPKDGQDTETLLRNADAAMYCAKELGRNNFQSYAAEMNTTISEKLSMQEGLRNALTRCELLLVYQPQVDLRSGNVIGVEALIRWQHPELGIIFPGRFIPLAEETGLVVPIGEWVLQTACRQNKAWQDAGMQPVSMSVNVSARQLREKDLVKRVALVLQESGLEAKYLELEFTESLIMQDVHQAVAAMGELNRMGVRLSIDDFGTGYSNLSALKHFPIDRLKIDQSFVHNIPEDNDDKAIASAVIALGHRLGLKVIAEGVESEEQLAFLRDNNCDEMQGDYFSRAVSARECEKILHIPSTIYDSAIDPKFKH